MLSNNYTIEELIDNTQAHLTMSGALPCILPGAEIRRIIEKIAVPYFYRNYYLAVQKTYFFIDKNVFLSNEYTAAGHVVLPEEIQSVVFTYGVGNNRGFFSGYASQEYLGNYGGANINYGTNLPGGNMNNSIPSQNPYMNSYINNVGNFSLYKVVLDGFADVLNQLNKITYKSSFNPNSKRYEVLTHINRNLILEVYAGIPAENLFSDILFQQYVNALSDIQLGLLLTRYDMPLAGNVKINGDAIKTYGEAEKLRVETEVKEMNPPSYFFTSSR